MDSVGFLSFRLPCRLGDNVTFDSYAALTSSKWLLGVAVPTLGHALWKIGLFRRFGVALKPKGIAASVWPNQATFASDVLRVQDEYFVSKADLKCSRILAVLEKARIGGSGTLHVNFASGYTPGFLGMPNITGD